MEKIIIKCDNERQRSLMSKALVSCGIPPYTDDLLDTDKTFDWPYTDDLLDTDKTFDWPYILIHPHAPPYWTLCSLKYYLLKNDPPVVAIYHFKDFICNKNITKEYLSNVKDTPPVFYVPKIAPIAPLLPYLNTWSCKLLL